MGMNFPGLSVVVLILPLITFFILVNLITGPAHELIKTPFSNINKFDDDEYYLLQQTHYYNNNVISTGLISNYTTDHDVPVVILAAHHDDQYQNHSSSTSSSLDDDLFPNTTKNDAGEHREVVKDDDIAAVHHDHHVPAVLVGDQNYSTSQQQLHLFQINSTLTSRENNVGKEVLRREIRDDDEIEVGLARARAAILKASRNKNISSLISHHHHHENGAIDVQRSHVYRNPSAFYQSYLEMEKRFKVYVYEEGDVPFVHDGPCHLIYTSEGRFIHEMELGINNNIKFRTRDARRAHVYFMPFSVAMMVKFIYEPNSHDMSPLKQFVSGYLTHISSKYPFWNRTQGADHVMLSCHDWGPEISKANPFLFNNSIRVLCNANTSEGFNPQKDVTLPEISFRGFDMPQEVLSVPDHHHLGRRGDINGLRRPNLAFFAGGPHGPIRPIIFKHWKGKDPDLRVYEYLPKNLNYYSLMFQSKFCLCPSGFEVASPRVVEAIYTECVPVIITDHYVLPFSDILKWEMFSVRVDVSDIPRLKEILKGISAEEYKRLKDGGRAVRRHFELNQPPKRFDFFHMILHSIWLRRLNIGRN